MDRKLSPYNELICVLALDCSYEEVCNWEYMLAEVELFAGVTGGEAEDLVEKIRQLKLSFYSPDQSPEIH